MIEKIETWRRDKKWSAQRITDELADLGYRINRRTVTRHLTCLGLGQRRFLDPCGDSNRQPGRITARWPGHMVHLDVKKVGRIPDGGGWRAHGRDSEQHRAVDRAKRAGARAGYVYLHSVVDGFSRLAYTEPLDDENAATTIGFLARARAWFAAHGITHHPPHRHRQRRQLPLDRLRPNRRPAAATSDTRPYTPRHNGKVERYQRILAEELLYAREFNSEAERSTAIAIWNIHYNYHRPHTTAGGRPPASRLKIGVTNVRPSYTRPPMIAARASSLG